MKDTIRLKIIKIRQPIGEIYIAKISPVILLKMSQIDRRRIADNDEVLGIQRELRTDKVKQIKNYLSTVDATFPNSIIVNTNSDKIVFENDEFIELSIDENTFTIIDGQHRLEGFRENDVKNFELLLAIFKDLRLDQQANIFSTINSQQTKVDPSHNLNLELNRNVYTPIKMMIEIAQSFNFDKESPWYNNIRMLGNQSEGIISLSAFVKPLLNLTYPDNDYYLILNKLTENVKVFPLFNDLKYNSDRYIFWEMYTRKDSNSIYKILLNYFSVLKIVLEKDWLNPDSILNKTTGYNAIMILFKDLAQLGLKQGDLSYEFFFKNLEGIKNLNGTINSSNYGASGGKASSDLYNEIKKTLANKGYI